MRFFEFGKEMGRKFSFLFGWEGKGKEKFCIFGVGRKRKEKEGENIVFWFRREMGRMK